jgi:hypothetical protein
MARTDYDVIEEYTGTGSLDTYTFDFKIESLAQLLVVELNTLGVQTQKVRGTDVTYIDSVTFDAEEGGGTVVLAANLTLNYKLKLILANDEPTQPSQFRNKGAFTLKSIENALDFVVGAVQRLAYRSARSVQLDESIMTAEFDPTLPVEIVGADNYVIMTNEDGDGWELGPSAASIQEAIDAGVAALAAQAAAEAAQAAAELAQTAAETAETNAETAETNAEAAQAAAEAAVASIWSVYTTHNITAGQSATALTDETWLSASYTSVVYEFEIIRGTTLNAYGRVIFQKQNGSWLIRLASYDGDVHGVTWSLTGTTTQQLNAAVGAGDNGTIKLTRRLVA